MESSSSCPKKRLRLFLSLATLEQGGAIVLGYMAEAVDRHAFAELQMQQHFEEVQKCDGIRYRLIGRSFWPELKIHHENVQQCILQIHWRGRWLLRAGTLVPSLCAVFTDSLPPHGACKQS